MPDFFGESGVDPFGTGNVAAPQKTAEQIRAEEEQRIYANYVRGLDANGNPLPAYGTPRSQGGTATGYAVTPAKLGARDSKPINGHPTVQLNRVTGLPGEGAEGFSAAYKYTTTPGGNGTKVTGSIGRQPYAMQAPGGAPGAGGLSQVQGDQAVANGLADQVLGSQPTVDPANQVNQANIDRLTPVVDPNLGRNAEIDRAFAMSSDLVDRILNAPSQTDQIADRSLSQMLAIGRSSPGGIGAVQAGVKGAMGAAPQIQAQAGQQAIQEQQARASAATGAAQIYAGVAAGTADRDVRIAEANQGAALSVINNLTTLTGMDYQFDTAKMGAIGQLTRDFFNNSQQFAQMDVQMQIAQWNNMTSRYGIDQNFKAAMEGIAASENIGPLDALKLVLGGAAAAGGLGAA
jgi:hypothetical protein